MKQNQLNAKHHACNNEQYQSKDNLLIFGISEKKGAEKENAKEAALQSMRVYVPTLTLNDIDVAHRVGSRAGDRPRPMIVRMYRHDVSYDVLMARKKLKGIKALPRNNSTWQLSDK